MVNTSLPRRTSGRVDRFAVVVLLVRSYFALGVATLVALVVLSWAAPHQASAHAWGHAVIVAGFACLLAIRLRSARQGSARAAAAVWIIAAVLLMANVVEAALPDVFPGWLRCQMAVVAVLMAAVVTQSVRARRG